MRHLGYHELATTPPIPLLECPMTNSKMLQSQFKKLAIIANNLKACVEDRTTLLKAKVDVSIYIF
jgi:hypothetical protein